MEKCKGSHDGKHRPIIKLGSKTGFICACCRKEVYIDADRKVKLENEK